MRLVFIQESSILDSRVTKMNRASARDFNNVMLLLPFIMNNTCYWLKYFIF